MTEKIIKAEALKERLKALKKAGKKVVFTNGCFDFLHVGHVRSLEAAKAEGHKDAERSFSYANEVEQIHAQLYQKMLEGLGGKQEDYPYYVCPVCGYTAEKDPPDTCPVCGTKGDKFKRVD